MKYAFQSKIFQFSILLEGLISIYILLATISCSIGMVFSMDLQTLFLNPDYIKQALNTASLIIIGVEFVKMICCHTIDTVIEVVLLALARQMILYHPSAFENTLTVIAIAILFIVRKYLFIAQIDRLPNESGSLFQIFAAMILNKHKDEINETESENTANFEPEVNSSI